MRERQWQPAPEVKTAPTCNNCRHWQPKKKVFGVIWITAPHPYCNKVTDSQGQPGFAEIERMWPPVDNFHCGIPGHFFEAK